MIFGVALILAGISLLLAATVGGMDAIGRILHGVWIGVMIALIYLVLLLLVSAPSHAQGFSCDTVKQFSWMGAAKGKALAQSFGYTVTPADEARARACLSPHSPQGSDRVTHKKSKQPLFSRLTKKLKAAVRKKDRRHTSVTAAVTPRLVASTPVADPPPKRVARTHVAAPTPTSSPASSPTSSPKEEPDMFSALHLLQLFAGFGVVAFTFCVGKYGLVPVYNKLKSGASTGLADASADIASLRTRVFRLEAAVRGVAPLGPPPPPSAHDAPTPPPAYPPLNPGVPAGINSGGVGVAATVTPPVGV